MKELFQVPAAVNKITTMADNSLKIEMVTSKELPPEQETLIMRLRRQEGYMVFSPSSVSKEDIPDIDLDTEVGETKSPSQRLRNSLYVLWSENTDKKTPFDTWYKQKMENIITQVKEKI